MGCDEQITGMKKDESKWLRFKCTKVAMRCSCHIYQCRKLKEWMAPLIQY